MANLNKIKRIKKIRLHHEGTHILITSAALLLAVNAVLYWGLECKMPFYVVAFVSTVVYLPLGSEVCVTMGQKTTGNQTVIAKLK